MVPGLDDVICGSNALLHSSWRIVGRALSLEVGMTKYYLYQFRLTLLILFLSLAPVAQDAQSEGMCEMYIIPGTTEVCKSGAIKIRIKEDKPSLFSGPDHNLQECIANTIKRYSVSLCSNTLKLKLDRVTISGWYNDKLYYVGVVSAEEGWRLYGVPLSP